MSNSPSEPKWTPGPWTATHSDPAEGVDLWWICAGEKNFEKEVATVNGGYPHDLTAGNARLITASTDLYEALEEAERYIVAILTGPIMRAAGIEWPEGGPNGAVLQKARAALAKARGEAA